MILKERTEQFWEEVRQKNMDGIKAAYVDHPDTYVILEGPRYSTWGFQNIIKGWTDFCDTAIQLGQIDWVEGPQEEVNGDMGWIGGIIDMTIDISGRQLTTRFRCSFVYRFVDNDWKIRHEHVSAPLEDPYGIGDWLQTS